MTETARLELFALTNSSGTEIEVMNHGATVTALRVRDRDGKLDDVVLGFDDPLRYLEPHPYFGGIVGRFGNRIARGRFRLDGEEHVLSCNNGPHHLHGGVVGFDRKIWTVEPKSTTGGKALVLRRTSAHAEEGYPGTLACEVTFTLTEADEFRIDYLATTDRPTVLNLTHHSYFNLAGGAGEDVLGHELLLEAEAFTPVNESLIPTGEVRGVEGTPFDFLSSASIGAALKASDPQLAVGRGFDHNFVLKPEADPAVPRLAARLHEPRSGRVMDILTTEPGLQLYTGGALDGSLVGKKGRRYGRHAGLCLETQHFPDSPNQPAFPSARLDPGQVFRSVTIHRFSTTR